jgi:hypothetical protein
VSASPVSTNEQKGEGEKGFEGDVGRSVAKVLATGSVKIFGDGDIEQYASWSKNLSGSEWASKEPVRSKIQAPNEDGRSPSGANESRLEERTPKFEVTAFAVSPDHQSLGLGARVLNEIEWLIASSPSGPSGPRFQALQGRTHPAAEVLVKGLFVGDSDGSEVAGQPVARVDVTKFKEMMQEWPGQKLGQQLRPSLSLGLTPARKPHVGRLRSQSSCL